MGDKATLEKARRELEEMYLGVPDDSVNLTLQDFAEVRQQQQQQQQHHIISSSSDKKKSLLMEPISETTHKGEGSSSSSAPLTKLPSLDFSRSIQASMHSNNHHHLLHHAHNNHHLRHPTAHHAYDPSRSHSHHQLDDDILRGHDLYAHHRHGHSGHHTHHSHGHGLGHGHYAHDDHHQARHGVENSMAFSDISQMSGMSMASMHHQRGGGRRRPGIPHSNICTICSNYIYIFRHRCLVCGRVYCRQCMRIGMGEMTEGRKCIQCLGRRFSQRYIQKAGQVGCCMGYPSTVKQQELKWAEKGPRRSGENRYGRSSMMPRSPSPMTTPRTPPDAGPHSPSFVMNSPYSPYSSAHFPMPL